MNRYFFISDDLDDLERLEEDLEAAGVLTPQIHVLSLKDSAVARHHHLNAVTDLMKTDLVHSTLIGAALGVCAALLALLVPWAMGWTTTEAGWLPFVFLAIVLLGFLTWEGGLRGIETPNAHFRRFEAALKKGQHVFFVDLEPGQEDILNRVLQRHPTVKEAGTQTGAPHWLIAMQFRMKRFFTETFP